MRKGRRSLTRQAKSKVLSYVTVKVKAHAAMVPQMKKSLSDMGQFRLHEFRPSTQFCSDLLGLAALASN